MPVLHDYECSKCGRTTEAAQSFEKRELLCPHCGSFATRIVSFGKKARNLDIFQPYREEHLGDDAPEVISHAHLSQLCRERGIASRRLMEGYRNYGPKREI